MKIGILKTDTVRAEYAPTYGEYSDMFANLLLGADPSLEFVTYDAEHNQFPVDLDEADGYLITGSKRSVYEDEPWIQELADFVRRAHAAKKKLVGICFGHQIIAQALGGVTTKSDKGWGVGQHSYQVTAPGFPLSEIHLNVSHQDQVLEPAPGSKILGSSDFCPNAICQIDSHILTMQAHPEFSKDYTRELVELRKKTKAIDDAHYRWALDSLEKTTSDKEIARWIVDFIRG